jgi:hypothetical protein
MSRAIIFVVGIVCATYLIGGGLADAGIAVGLATLAAIALMNP